MGDPSRCSGSGGETAPLTLLRAAGGSGDGRDGVHVGEGADAAVDLIRHPDLKGGGGIHAQAGVPQAWWHSVGGYPRRMPEPWSGAVQ